MTSLLERPSPSPGLGVRVLPLHSPLPGPRCTCGEPTCDNIGKHPRIKRGCHGAVRDPDQIRRWWNRWPDANLGLATGSASGIYVIDVDPRHGGDETLRALEAEHGPLPPTWRFLTGGGGEHIVFRYPGRGAAREQRRPARRGPRTPAATAASSSPRRACTRAGGLTPDSPDGSAGR